MSEKKDIGALWKKTSQKGKEFFSGVITINGEKHQIVIFPNDYKKEDKHPDYKIFPSTPRGDSASF